MSLDTTVLYEYERPEYTIRGAYYVRERINLIRTSSDSLGLLQFRHKDVASVAWTEQIGR